jgi:hypothetical protein
VSALGQWIFLGTQGKEMRLVRQRLCFTSSLERPRKESVFSFLGLAPSPLIRRDAADPTAAGKEGFLWNGSL